MELPELPEPERAAFEKHAAWRALRMQRREDGDYASVQTGEAWAAWQEAVKQEREACEKLCRFYSLESGDVCADAIRARSEP